MLFATMLGIVVIPIYYVIVQRVSERKMPFRDDEPPPRERGATAGEQGDGGT
jgi:HAE1 family hydrophobic/amphiphilic exporter-1/multidrug efflux pump